MIPKRKITSSVLISRALQCLGKLSLRCDSRLGWQGPSKAAHSCAPLRRWLIPDVRLSLSTVVWSLRRSVSPLQAGKNGGLKLIPCARAVRHLLTARALSVAEGLRIKTSPAYVGVQPRGCSPLCQHPEGGSIQYPMEDQDVAGAEQVNGASC